MIEVAGHVPINQLEQNARWQEICFKGRMLYSSLGSGKPTLSSVGRGTGPPLPRLSGEPRRIWAPRPLSSASYMRRPGNAGPSRAPTYIDAKRAERLVPPSRASAAGRPRRRSADYGPSSPPIAACPLCRDSSHDWSASDSRAGPGNSADGPWMLTATGRAQLGAHTPTIRGPARACEDYPGARRLGRLVRI
jgi:hypothetical protein